MIGAVLKAIPMTLCLLLSVDNAAAVGWQDLWLRADQQAHQKLLDGDPSAAAAQFNDPGWRGIGHYKAGEFEQAQKEFSTGSDEAARYNQAVTTVRQGDYEGAVEQFESLLQDFPENTDARHNLEIARELAKKKQEQQQQQGGENQPGDEQQDGQNQEGQDQSEQNQNGQQQDGSNEGDQQQDGEQSDNEDAKAEDANAHENGEQQDAEAKGGELTADPSDVSNDDPAADAESGELQQARQSEAGSQSEGEPEAEGAAQALLQQAPSEDEQATEQWLRRIPDDPSQLLRNKIKLNHLKEHADVLDMQEPW